MSQQQHPMNDQALQHTRTNIDCGVDNLIFFPGFRSTTKQSMPEPAAPLLPPSLAAFDPIAQGIVSAVSLKETLKFLNQTSKIETVGSVLLLNGFIFGGSLLVRDFLMFPLLFDRLASLFSEESSVDNSTVKEIITQIFNVLLLAPIFIVSNLLNIVWCSEIVEDAFRKFTRNTAKPVPRPAQESLRDELYRLALFFVLVVQSYLCQTLLPRYVGLPVDFLQQCFVLAFYCYDYGWSLRGLGFQSRLEEFQSHWVFMLGFGMPLSLISALLPMFWGYMLSSLLFPFCAILAIQKPPIRHNVGWPQLRVFRVAQFFTLHLIKFATKEKKKKQV